VKVFLSFFLVNIRQYREEYDADKLLRSVAPPIPLDSLINLQTQGIAQAAVQAVESATLLETPENPEISEAITVDIRPIWRADWNLIIRLTLLKKRPGWLLIQLLNHAIIDGKEVLKFGIKKPVIIGNVTCILKPEPELASNINNILCRLCG
jgi:hypothetical protein